ncbi:MAG: T9SS type A sorting domain-containing protein [Bacteroidota bacterium]
MKVADLVENRAENLDKFNLEQLTIAINPNPAANQFNVVISNDETDNFLTEIYDVIGRRILTNEYDNSINSNFIINTSTWEEGIYFVVISTVSEKVVERVMISRN